MVNFNFFVSSGGEDIFWIMNNNSVSERKAKLTRGHIHYPLIHYSLPIVFRSYMLVL